MATPYLGAAVISSFGFAPRGWAVCNGELLPINQEPGPLFHPRRHFWRERDHHLRFA